jgi:hypothetical protein
MWEKSRGLNTFRMHCIRRDTVNLGSIECADTSILGVIIVGSVLQMQRTTIIVHRAHFSHYRSVCHCKHFCGPNNNAEKERAQARVGKSFKSKIKAIQ